MAIIDAQVHVWGEAQPDWPANWRQRVHLPEPITYQNLVDRMSEAGVDRAVLVPPSWQGDSADYCLEAAATHPRHFGVMARIALKAPLSRADLEAWARRKGMLGIRLTFHQAENRAWIADGTAEWLWPLAQALRIPIMVHAPPAESRRKLGEIAARHPDLRLVLDHMGLGRESRDERVGPALAETIALASHPNVAVKMSMVPYFSTAPYPYRNIHADLRRVFDAFGPRRCFWGTDLSLILSTTHITYRQAVEIFTQELDFMTADDKRWVMGDAIADWLDWRL